MVMKCADLGHLASAEPAHLQWVSLLEEEVGAVQLKLEVGRPKSQHSELLTHYDPGLQILIQMLILMDRI